MKQIEKGDWVQWYDHRQGRFCYGSVLRISTTETYPKEKEVYTDNGMIRASEVVEVRRGD